MKTQIKTRLLTALTIASLSLGSITAAQQTIGAVTNLPLPRFVSMKTTEAFARRGPGKTHRIDWKYVRRNMPLKVVAEHGHWRRVEDDEGMGGWIHYALLSRTRTVMVTAEQTDMYPKPTGLSRLVAKLTTGVVGKLISCTEDLCEIETTDVDGKAFKGWVKKGDLWGLTKDD